VSSKTDEWVPRRDDGSARLGARPWARHAAGFGQGLARGRQPARGGLPARAPVAALAPHRAGLTSLVIRAVVLAACGSLLLAVPAPPARAALKKGMWGPVEVNGASQFPIYRELGATVYNTGLNWRNVAVHRPTNPRDPRDPAYRWPARLGDAVEQAAAHHIQLAMLVKGTPAWANGGRSDNWVPSNPADYADFVVAAARRYPSVRFWIIWGEPTRAGNFFPIPSRTNPSARLSQEAIRTVRSYAQILDASYAALKGVSKRKIVVGGNSFTTGDISPLNWIRYMRLPNGRRPRMDLYGHNPYSARRPRLSDRAALRGYADFSDLDDLARWLDRYYGRDPRGKPMRIWIGEWSVPTDHGSYIFGFWTTRQMQASWLRAALRIADSSPRIFAVNWLALYDEAPRSAGDETNWGLIDHTGRRKPAFWVFQRG
jgi:hypothetical protein